MDNNKILIIDLKNRLDKNSIILNLDECGDKLSNTILELDINKCIKGAKKSIKEREYVKGEEILNKSKILLSNNRVLLSDLEIKEYLFLSKLVKAVILSEEILIQENSLDNYVKCRDIINDLGEIGVEEGFYEFRDAYNNILNTLKNKIKSFDTRTMLRKIESEIENLNSIYEVMRNIDMVNSIKFEGKEDRDTLREINSIREKILNNVVKEYSNGIDTYNNIKILCGYKYKDLIDDKEYEKYIKLLNKIYTDYNECVADINEIHNVLRLNNSTEFNEFKDVLFLLPLTRLVNLTKYLREYVARKLFYEDANYYSVEEIIKRTDDIINEVNLSNYPTMIPI
ncbi:MAG: hypothetical protein RR636_12995 [Clostridium sp.]|uniref:hypothetical protein n=1 Tax=Clostridium sp. TaxID=1506 RepID=UPI00321739F8